ncbi:molybdenum cofactor guanylyltransferase [Desulfogranum japonicum]|uniref:molybdenum cofactor guanylyltransferase n=1 Tax=Desulfogranum japonicum TaxID=231447 RepID=UPI0004920BA5|nr:molybdenum cofactor guanylyltransferase [Desulfogranum japonicum]
MTHPMVQLWDGATPVVLIYDGSAEQRKNLASRCSVVLETTESIVECLYVQKNTDGARIVSQLDLIVRSCDVFVLVSEKWLPLDTLIAGVSASTEKDPSSAGLEQSLSMGSNAEISEPVALKFIHWFVSRWTAAEVGACLLVGGKSSRMGRAKHLIQDLDGITWAEKTVQTLQLRLNRLVISGAGELPDAISHLPRVPDEPGVAGPIAGILSVLKHYPGISWVVTACDMPEMRVEALDWLLSCRRPGVRGIFPDLSGQGRVEPLLAYYDFRVLDAVQNIVDSGSWRISRLKEVEGVLAPRPPSRLFRCWRNINTPRELLDNT